MNSSILPSGRICFGFGSEQAIGNHARRDNVAAGGVEVRQRRIGHAGNASSD
jgi:hypothetical protein